MLKFRSSSNLGVGRFGLKGCLKLGAVSPAHALINCQRIGKPEFHFQLAGRPGGSPYCPKPRLRPPLGEAHTSSHRAPQTPSVPGSTPPCTPFLSPALCPLPWRRPGERIAGSPRQRPLRCQQLWAGAARCTHCVALRKHPLR